MPLGRSMPSASGKQLQSQQPMYDQAICTTIDPDGGKKAIMGFLVCADPMVKIGSRYQLHCVDLVNPVSQFFLKHVLKKGMVQGFQDLSSMGE